MSKIFPSEEHRAELLMRLKLLGVSEITVGFSGGGDSGSIEDVMAVSADGGGVDLENQPSMSWVKETSTHNRATHRWDKHYVSVDLSLKDILIQMTEQALEEASLDWYNNDGGQGYLAIDFTMSPPDIRLEIGINRIETDQHLFRFSGTGELEREDDDAPTSP